MTAKELRRDINKLYDNTMAATYESMNYWVEHEPGFIREFQRLYHADKDFECANLKSLKQMVWLNAKLNCIKMFGIHTIL